METSPAQGLPGGNRKGAEMRFSYLKKFLTWKNPDEPELGPDY